MIHQGVGAFAAPLVCQTLIAKGIPWQNFYFGSIVPVMLNTVFLIYTFKPTRQEFEDDRQFALNLVNSALGRRTADDLRSGNKSRSSSVTCIDAPSPVNSKFKL